MTTYNGAILARAWLSVAVASSTDKQRPQLNRTVSIESYPEGVRLTATDSYVLLTAFVPDIDHHEGDEPEIGEAPVSTAVAMDDYGRAKSFFEHVLTLDDEAQEDEYADRPEVELTLGVIDTLDGGAAFAGMEALYVVVEMLDRERLKLRTYESAYPNWRRAWSAFSPVTTGAIALNPTIVGRLAKVAKLHNDAPLLWTFGGATKAAMIEFSESIPAVSGVVMPIRWDFDRNAPREDKSADDADA